MKNCLTGMMGIVLFLNLISCAPIVRTDLKSLQENPEAYKGKSVILIADIKSVIEAPEAYRDKKIEMTGYIVLDGFRRGDDWSFVLNDGEGRGVRCYEREYRLRSWIMLEMALRQANQRNEKITVVGKFERNGKIELDWIEYKDQHFDTDYKPPGIRLPFL